MSKPEDPLVGALRVNAERGAGQGLAKMGLSPGPFATPDELQGWTEEKRRQESAAAWEALCTGAHTPSDSATPSHAASSGGGVSEGFNWTRFIGLQLLCVLMVLAGFTSSDSGAKSLLGLGLVGLGIGGLVLLFLAVRLVLQGFALLLRQTLVLLWWLLRQILMLPFTLLAVLFRAIFHRD